MFIWNGISSAEKKIKIISLPSPSCSIERVEEIVLDGRDGHLTEVNGYESDTKSVEADYFGEDPNQILNWLTGSGEIIFSNMSDRYYKARISNKVPLEYILKNMSNFIINFRCQPFGYLLDGKYPILISEPTTLYNHGTYKSLPIISIYGAGACTININGNIFKVTDIGNKITIDSAAGVILDKKGNKMEGDFPVLEVGENNITWDGNITKIEITPNWRCLV